MRRSKMFARHSVSQAIAALAGELEEGYLAAYNAYLEDCAADCERGHRPHYCEHGTNQWVEYDAICGGCEDGITMGDEVQRAETAAYEARSRMRMSDEILAVVQILTGAGAMDAVAAKSATVYALDLLDAGR